MKHILLVIILALSFAMTGCATNGVDNGNNSAVGTEKGTEETITEENASAGDMADSNKNDLIEDNSGSSEQAVEEVDDKEVDANYEEEAASDKKDYPALRDAVTENFGARIGCAATLNELNDPKVFDIITTHFNTVTFGNELKPDALVNYSVDKCPGTVEAELNGETIIVPKLSYDRAEQMLDKILAWNEANPDREIKVRGHVLVWHSQTPEWFFHEDYDKKNDYVDKATMNKRLEWYIREVLTHFTGEDSKYKDMFYGWDVVNEAISDNGGKLRTDNENPNEKLSEDRHGSNSSWYHIYESNEFIINAFIYANKYAPETLELYYNDYNECNTFKRQGIAELLTAIKEKEGEKGVGTRITGMGMQGHYGITDPGFTDIEFAAKLYGGIVDTVQITELDITASSDYDGSEEAKEAENEKLKKRYNTIYFTLKSLKNNAGINVTGITFWGTVDHYSWLQSRSNVGGGNKSGFPQMPLLFDENYEPKPCFEVFTK